MASIHRSSSALGMGAAVVLSASLAGCASSSQFDGRDRIVDEKRSDLVGLRASADGQHLEKGSYFAIDAETVATARHVIEQDNHQSSSWSEMLGELVLVKKPHSLKPLPILSPNHVSEGEAVTILGYPGTSFEARECTLAVVAPNEALIKTLGEVPDGLILLQVPSERRAADLKGYSGGPAFVVQGEELRAVGVVVGYVDIEKTIGPFRSNEGYVVITRLAPLQTAAVQWGGLHNQ